MQTSKHIGILVEARYLTQAQPAGVIAALHAHGHAVTVLDPHRIAGASAAASWCASFDLLLCRGRGWHVLRLLDWAALGGVPVINRRAAIAAVYDKARMGLALAHAGIATPPTFLGTPAQLAHQV